MIIAMKAATTVPKNTAAIPNTGGLPCGFQVWVVNRLPELPVNAGIAFQTAGARIVGACCGSTPAHLAAMAAAIGARR
jgi:methionine synthase I (cobalamin-dependent)